MERKRQNNGRGETDQQLIKTDNQRIFYDFDNVRVVEELFEIFQPDPFTPHNPFSEGIILKSYQDAPHRHITENQDINDRKQKHQI